MVAGIRVRLADIPSDNLNNPVLREKDIVAMDFNPQDLEMVEELLKRATVHCTIYDEQRLYHGLIARFHQAFLQWQELRNKKWQEEHPKAGGN